MKYTNTSWGCEFSKLYTEMPINNIRVCQVRVTDIQKMSKQLTAQTLDTSWMTNLDWGVKRAYDKTAKQTAEELVNIFQSTACSTDIGKEFGEMMVSIGSSKALEQVFNHLIIPLAELWKPQFKQNEGFDFHSECPNQLINFGEAKYSSSKNPYSDAINQTRGFIVEEKHLRDRVHLVNLTSNQAIKNLDNDDFGVVASFSINSNNPSLIINNAIKKAKESFKSIKIKTIYLVGIINENN